MRLFLLALLLGSASMAQASDEPPVQPAPAALPTAAQEDGADANAAMAAAPAARKDDERMVCVRQKKLGTNMSERVCTTLNQREAAKERARAEFERANR